MYEKESEPFFLAPIPLVNCCFKRKFKQMLNFDQVHTQNERKN